MRCRRKRRRYMLGQWRELGLIVAIDGLVVAAILGQFGVAAWPLALLAFIGVTGTLFVACLVVLGTLLRYEGAVTGLPQLARPATFALLWSVPFVVIFALLRLMAEAQGILPPLQLPWSSPSDSVVSPRLDVVMDLNRQHL